MDIIQDNVLASTQSSKQEDFVGAKFYSRMTLLMATSAFRLERRH